MHVVIIHCHPEPKSFNATLTDAAVAECKYLGDTVEVSDLYAQEFDPVEKAAHYGNRENDGIFSPLAEQRHAYQTKTLPHEVEREIDRLERADLVVFQFPIWWHSVPAMLKGWFDRVFVSGGLYTSKMRYDRGYFRGRRAVCSVTTGAPAVSFEAGGRGGEISQILWSTNYSLYYMGFEVLSPFVSYGVQGHGFSYASDEEFEHQLQATIRQWINRLRSISRDKPLAFPGWADWDDMGRLRIGSQSTN